MSAFTKVNKNKYFKKLIPLIYQHCIALLWNTVYSEKLLCENEGTIFRITLVRINMDNNP